MRLCPECGATFADGIAYCPDDGNPLADTSSDPLLGQQVGPYVITKVLGAGGMGQVYLATHPDIGSQVAIKVLSDECTQRPELVERFFAEARSVNRIRHEAIVNVLDLATLPDGRPYIVMERLRGTPLSSVMQHHGVLPLGTFARMVNEVLSGLAAAHETGVIHRDLKPDNIFVSPQGRTKILDFGVAKLMPQFGAEQAKATKTGAMIGTPHYMSPEQILGKPIGPRADLYAMGVILYEGVTGKVPFHSDALFSLMNAHLTEAPALPSKSRRDLPRDYENVILQALAKEPEHRFASAEAMARALANATGQLPESAWAAISQGGQFPGIQSTPTPADQSGPSGLQSTFGSPPPRVSQLSPPPATRSSAVEFGATVTPAEFARSGAGLASQRALEQAAPTQREIDYAPATVRDRSPEQTTARGPVRRPGIGTPIKAALFIGLLAGAAVSAYFVVNAVQRRSPATDKVAATSGQADASQLSPPADAVIPTPLPNGPPADTPETARKEDGGGNSPGEKQEANRSTKPAKDRPADKQGQSAPSPPPTAPSPPPKVPTTNTPASPGGVTFISTADLGQKKTGLKPISASVANTGRFRGIAYYPTAQSMARRLMPDVFLIGLEVANVSPNGTANVNFGRLEASYWFRSKSRSRRPKGVPVNLEVDIPCKVYVDVSKGKAKAYVVTDEDCNQRRLPRPRCSLKQVWARAIQRGAPTNRGTASIELLSGGWYFDIRKGAPDGGDWTVTIPNNC